MRPNTLNVRNVLALVFIFFILFFNNRFNIYEDFTIDYKNQYKIGNNTSISWIVGSIIKSRNDGIFSDGPFSSRYIFASKTKKEGIREKYQYQTDIYLTNGELERKGSWQIYKSALRWPIQLCVLLDTLHFKVFGVNTNVIFTVRTLFDLLTSGCLLLLIIWAYREFDLIGFFIMLGLCLFFPKVNESNIVGPIFIYLLPFSILLNRFQKEKENHLFIIVLGLIFIQQAIKYEQTTMVLASVFLPMFYYAISRQWNFKTTLRYFKTSFFAAITAVFGVLILHFLFLVANFGFEESTSWFSGKLIQRTYSELETVGIGKSFSITEATKTNLSTVLYRFFIMKKLQFNINAIGYLFVNLAMTIGLLMLIKKKNKSVRKLLGLSILTLLSFCSILAYFIVFKSQAAGHEFPLSFFQFPFIFFLYFSIILLGSTVIKLLLTFLANKTIYQHEHKSLKEQI